MRFALSTGTHSVVGFDLSGSFGPYDTRFCGTLDVDCTNDRVEYDVAIWVNTGAFFEHRFDNGILIRPTLGRAWLVNPDAASCTKPDQVRCESRSDALLFASLTIGAWKL